MEGLIDCLDTNKWEEVPAAKKPDGFVEVHVNPHAHKQLTPTSFAYMIESDDVSPRTVNLEHAKKDPIKKVAVVEMRLGGADGLAVTGIDLDGDIVVLKA